MRTFVAILAATSAHALETVSADNKGVAVNSEHVIRSAYMQFIAEYGKSYATQEHMEDRFQAFKTNYLKIEGHNAFQSLRIGCSFDDMGTSRVAIFFFVIMRGKTTVPCMIFSHRNDKHSVTRQAVNRHTESAARNFGPHAAII